MTNALELLTTRRSFKPFELAGPAPSAAEIDALVAEGDLCMDAAARMKFERNLEYARSIAKDDPKLVAMVIKSWVSDER